MESLLKYKKQNRKAVNPNGKILGTTKAKYSFRVLLWRLFPHVWLPTSCHCPFPAVLITWILFISPLSILACVLIVALCGCLSGARCKSVPSCKLSELSAGVGVRNSWSFSRRSVVNVHVSLLWRKARTKVNDDHPKAQLWKRADEMLHGRQPICTKSVLFLLLFLLLLSVCCKSLITGKKVQKKKKVKLQKWAAIKNFLANLYQLLVNINMDNYIKITFIIRFSL